MPDVDDSRSKAAEMRERAAAADDPIHRAEWLRLAKLWDEIAAMAEGELPKAGRW